MEKKRKQALFYIIILSVSHHHPFFRDYILEKKTRRAFLGVLSRCRIGCQLVATALSPLVPAGLLLLLFPFSASAARCSAMATVVLDRVDMYALLARFVRPPFCGHDWHTNAERPRLSVSTITLDRHSP